MTIKNQIIALNTLLADIFQQENMRISQFLMNIGITNNDIEIIGNNRMKELADGLARIFQYRIFGTDTISFEIIEKKYGLNGKTPNTLREIGEDFNISGERTRQLEKQAVNHCKSANSIALLSEYAKSLALGLIAECKPECKHEAERSETKFLKKECKHGMEPNGTEFLRQYGQNPLDNRPKMIDRNNHVPQIRYLPEKGNVIRIADKTTGQTVILREDAVETFLAHLKEAIGAAGWNKNLAEKRKAEIRQKFPRAYESWTENEERTLKEGFERGLGAAELSAILGRQPGAIESRLSKLGLKPECKN